MTTLYIGPGLGAVTIIIVIIVLLIVILSLFMILWTPIKVFWMKIKDKMSSK